MTSFSTTARTALTRCTFFGPKATRSPSAAKILVENAPPSRNAANTSKGLKLSAPKAASF